VPPSLVEKAIVGETEDDVMNLARSFYGARDGYANTHDMPSFETFVEQATAGPHATPEGRFFLVMILYLYLL